MSEPACGTGINDKACPVCNQTDSLEVINHDMMWHDGEVWCTRCNVFVRYYDAG